MNPIEQRTNYLVGLIEKHGWTHGAEIGVLVGRLHFNLLDRCPDLNMIAVDSWRDKSGSCTYPNQIANRAEFYERASCYGSRVNILEKDSAEAASYVPDESLDFVFIDGDHTYEACRRDILHWTPKVKQGGWILGHDFIEFVGVNQAVKELFHTVNAPESVDESWARPKLPSGSNAVTICCIKWGDKYGPEYVNALASMVMRNVHLVGHDFVCFTDDPRGIDPHIRTAPLPCHYDGWWQKVGLFKPQITGVYTDKILFLDLDVVITGDLDAILETDADWAICHDWPEEIRPGDTDYNSSAFFLKVGSQPQVWDDFDMRLATPLGDQYWIQNTAPGAVLWPYDWTPSYKLRKLESKRPEGAKIVVFHGDPKPPDCGGWVKDMWK
jgi:hypothetical protein